jgi:RecA-family ATPase
LQERGKVMERVIVNYKNYLNDVLSRLNDVKNKRMNILSPSEIETLNEANTIIRSIRKELYGE